jgi:putative intracellular protease/amidase
LKRARRLWGRKEGLHVNIDKSIEEAKVSDFDALLIPGGLLAR